MQRKWSFLVLVLAGLGVLVACAPAEIETPELIARADLFGTPDRAGVQISPDGKHLSYLAALDDVDVLNIWIAPTDALDRARPITHADSRPIRRYFWAYDNKHIVYLQDKAGDENWRAYSIDITTGEEIDLTPMDGIQAQIQAVSERVPGEILLGINDRDARLHDIYRIDLTTGERTLVVENPGYVGFLADADYNVRLGMRMTDSGGMEIMAYQAGQWELFSEIPQEDSLTTQPIGFDESGDTLYMLDSRGRNTSALMAVNLETRDAEVIYANDRADVSQAMIHPTKRTVQAVASTVERLEWKILDESIQADLDYLATVADGEIEVTNRTLDDTRWIVGYELSDQPYSYYLYDREAKHATYLFGNRAALEDKTLAKMHSLTLKSRDGMDLISYLTLPVETDADGDGRPKEPIPMVLFVHGGPWGRDNYGYSSFHQWGANRGYAVLSVNFRGSTGLGKAFTNAGDMEWSGKMHDDLIDAVDWAIAEGIAIEDRIAIMGGSYGGYATLVGLTFTPDKFACGVDIVGPSNLITLLDSIPPYWEPMKKLFTSRVGDPDTEEGHTILVNASPLTHVDKITKPLLIGQGANDPRVKQAESDQIVDAMNAKNIPVTYVLYPDEGHGFARPENMLSFVSVAETFLGDCLGGRVEPFGTDLEGSSITVPSGIEHIRGLDAALGTEESAETETSVETENAA
ncbi:MAG: S9 family peptidase [Acidobacteria bacterium]|nr:MAG: S9 family peptidase [Acidobacteriota bacterium]